MTTLYLDLMSHIGVDNAYQLDTPLLMKNCGYNFGNFAFRYGLSKILPLDHAKISNCEINLDKNEKIDKVILSCANWVSENPLDEEKNYRRFKLLDSLDCPVYSFGLGVQANSGVRDLKLGRNTRKLLSLLSERSNVISLRDKLSQDVLFKNGVTNTEITGCPSNFINLDSDLPNHIYRHSKFLISENKLSEIKTHVTECSSIEQQKKLLAKTIKFLKKNQSSYVLQSPDLVPFLRDRASLSGAYPTSSESIFRQKSVYFTNFSEWLEFCRTCDLSFGMRIHGNMIPLQASRPALLIHHDQRTKGLSEVMGLPSIGVDDFNALGHSRIVKKVLEMNLESMFDYSEKRIQLHGSFMKVIVSNNLQVNDDFKTMYIR